MTALRGTGVLLRASLRRDRVSSSLWVLLLAAMAGSTAARYRQLFPSDAVRRAFAAGIGSNRALAAFSGQIFAPTAGALVVFKIGSSMYSLVALMAVLIVVRNTRAEEDSGRHELIAAGVVGRSAALTAALLAAAGTSVAAGLAVGAALAACGLPIAGAVAFAAAMAAPGVFFAAVGGLAAQLAPSARGATIFASGALGASFAIRFVADGSGHHALRWLSPEGWSHEVRPFVDNRIGVVGLALLAAALVAGAAYLFANRRDLGSGVLRPRLGPADAPRMRGPFALAWRLQRGQLYGWIVGLGALGALAGSLAHDMPALVRNQGPMVRGFFQRFGSVETSLSDAFLWLVALTIGYTASLYPALAILRLRAEETVGTAELLLATPVARTRWVASHVACALLGSVAMLAVSGAAMALLVGLDAHDLAGQFPRVLLSVVVQTPAVVALGGVGMLAVGFVPRLATGIVWAVWLALNVFGEFLAPALGFESSAADRVSPFHYLPHVLAAEPMRWSPVLGLGALTALMLAAGTWGMTRRDLG